MLTATRGNPAAAIAAAAAPTIGQTPDVEVLGDSAYATGDMLHQLDEKRWKPLLRAWPIRPAVEGGFTIDNCT